MAIQNLSIDEVQQIKIYSAIKEMLIQFEKDGITTVNEAIIHLDEKIHHTKSMEGK